MQSRVLHGSIHPGECVVSLSGPVAVNASGLAYSLSRRREGRTMKREYHRWYSDRLGLELGVVVHGHWGQPLLGFPTSAGDEFELEGQSMVGALADFIEGGKIKFYSINSINGLSFYNK